MEQQPGPAASQTVPAGGGGGAAPSPGLGAGSPEAAAKSSEAAPREDSPKPIEPAGGASSNSSIGVQEVRGKNNFIAKEIRNNFSFYGAFDVESAATTKLSLEHFDV